MGPVILGGGVPVSIILGLTPVTSLPGPILGQLTYFNQRGTRAVTEFFDEITVSGDPDGAFQPEVRVKSLTVNAQGVRIMIRVG
jgi:hypothetical protein